MQNQHIRKIKKSTLTPPHSFPKSHFNKMKPERLIHTPFSATNSDFIPNSLRLIQGKSHFGLSQQNPKGMNDVNRYQEVDS